MSTQVQKEKQAKKDREAEMKEEIRTHLSFLSSNISNIPDEHLDKTYKEDLTYMISQVRYYITHNAWDKRMKTREHAPIAYINTPMSYLYHTICRKNGGVADLTSKVAAPKMAWTRQEKQYRDMLKASLIRAINYVEPPAYHPEWNFPKTDERNTHPAAVAYRATLTEEEKQEARDEHAEYMAKQRKQERLEKESEERLKLKEKQRKDREKHFARLEKERRGEMS